MIQRPLSMPAGVGIDVDVVVSVVPRFGIGVGVGIAGCWWRGPVVAEGGRMCGVPSVVCSLLLACQVWWQSIVKRRCWCCAVLCGVYFGGRWVAGGLLLRGAMLCGTTVMRLSFPRRQ